MIPASITQAVEFLQNRIPFHPDIMVILGSGMGDTLRGLSAAVEIPYGEIPGFVSPTVAGHKGKVVVGKVGERKVLGFCGRIHYYEGHPFELVTLPVRVGFVLGAKTLIVTNAAGGINQKFRVGDFMAITDHLNLMGASPLRGPNIDDLGPRFIPMVNAYDPIGVDLMDRVAQKFELPLLHGVYAALSGPMYETPAEVRMLGTLGADAVGMSTVPEVIIARHQGMRVFGISCITNEWGWVFSGKRGESPTHEEVQAVTQKLQPTFAKFLFELIRKI